jgi:hypothetical protein
VLGVALVLAALGAVGFVSQPSASAQSAPSRVIDRTFLCTTGVQAGIRKLELQARSGTRDAEKPNRWQSLADMVVSTPSTDTTLAAQVLLRTSAGRGGLADPPNVGVDGGLDISPKRCKASRARVPLSSRGLSGGPLVFEEKYECFPPRSLVVRVRASFRTPTRLKRNSFGFLGTVEGPRQVEFAMRTRAGRPFVYGSVSDSGKARLFFVGSCVRD